MTEEEALRRRYIQILACLAPPYLAALEAGTIKLPSVPEPPDDGAAGPGEEPHAAHAADAALDHEAPPARRPRWPPRWLCVHEAGHALARWYLGLPFESVSVGGPDAGCAAPGVARTVAGAVTGFALVAPRADWVALGERGDPSALARGRMEAEMEVFAAYAGPFAEARVPRSYRVMAAAAAPVRRRSRPAVDVLLHTGGGEEDWALIAADAADWPDGIAMAASARRLARAFVRGDAAWEAIREVARLLAARRRLSWDDIDAIASRHFGHSSPACCDWLPHWPPLALAVRGGFLPRGPAGGRASGVQERTPCFLNSVP